MAPLKKTRRARRGVSVMLGFSCYYDVTTYLLQLLF